MPIEALKVPQVKHQELIKPQPKITDADINKTLKGVLINSHVKANQNDNTISFDEIRDSLLINDPGKYYAAKKEIKMKEPEESSFNTKKALKPLLIGTGVVLAASLGATAILKHASKSIATTPHFEQLPDLAVNMNIREEPQFALYRAIRDPNSRNILGAIGVFLMSGITIAFKNFVEGTKSVWLKKQSADVEKNLQENLIAVETSAFSGKLKVVNELMDKNVKYFDKVINNKTEAENTPSIFAKFLSFKGDNKENTQKTETKEKSFFQKNWKYIALVGGVLAGAIIAGKISLNNLKKAAEYTNKFANDFAEKTIDTINGMSEKADANDLPKVKELLKSICAKPEYVREVGAKYKLPEAEIQSIIEGVQESKKTIFADAPLALGGIPKKIQYYCYIDEDRGHLYNWILNPKNKFTKYVFLAFTSSSVGGYLFKEVMDATKDAAVMRENAKTDLSLKKNLVDVEIANFRAKKESAIQPMIDNFTNQANNGTKPKEELKQLADNILTEIKNGPPYVYT
jgi:hypothetical protein